MRCSACSKKIDQEEIDNQKIGIKYTYTNLIPTLCNECYKKHLKILATYCNDELLTIINKELGDDTDG